MGTNFTDFATTDFLVAATVNDRLDELDAALGSRPDVIDVSVTAGEDIAIREVVYISTSNGQAYLASAGSRATSSQAWLLGIATEAISSGSSGSVRLVGVVDGFSGLTAGQVQYISGTAGALTGTQPVIGVIVGIALSSTQLLVMSRGSQQYTVADLTGYATGLAGAPPTYSSGSIT
jgi:hypothetical protein